MTHPLAALIAGVKVKPLVWEEDFADHPFGWYETIDCGDCIVLTQSSVTVGSYPTLDAAKAAAQADYEARILAALEAATPPDLVEAGKVLDQTVNTAIDLSDQNMDVEAKAVGKAADTIRALIALATAQAAQIEGLTKQLDNLSAKLEIERLLTDGIHRRAEAAETALAAMTKERDDLANANHRQASCIHVAAANLGPNCSATVDGLPKAARHVAAERDALLLAAQGLVEVLDQNETKGPLPDTALMFCWLAAQNVRAVLRGIMLEKPE